MGKQQRKSVRISLRLSLKKEYEVSPYIRHAVVNHFNDTPTYQLRTYVIGLEFNLQPEARSFCHLQCALQFEVAHSYQEIREVAMAGFGNLLVGMHIGGISTMPSFRTYCSKTDPEALNRGPTKHLSRYHNCVRYVTCFRKLQYNDPVTFNMRNSLAYLKQLYTEVNRARLPPFQGYQYSKLPPIGWCLELIEHLKYFVENEEDSVRTRRHICLWGRPNTGKSTSVRLLFTQQDYALRVFHPRDNSQFYLSGLDRHYEAVVLDEFTLKCDYEPRVAQLNKLLGGNAFQIDVKCVGSGDSIEWLKPVIIITNEDPRSWPITLLTRIKLIPCQESVTDLIKAYCTEHNLDPSVYNEKAVVLPAEESESDMTLQKASLLAKQGKIRYNPELKLMPSIDCKRPMYPEDETTTQPTEAPKSKEVVTVGPSAIGVPNVQDLMAAGPSRPVGGCIPNRNYTNFRPRVVSESSTVSRTQHGTPPAPSRDVRIETPVTRPSMEHRQGHAHRRLFTPTPSPRSARPSHHHTPSSTNSRRYYGSSGSRDRRSQSRTSYRSYVHHVSPGPVYNITVRDGSVLYLPGSLPNVATSMPNSSGYHSGTMTQYEKLSLI